MNLLSLLDLGHPSSPALGHRGSWFLGLLTETGAYTISTLILGLRLNYTTGFLGSPVCR